MSEWKKNKLRNQKIKDLRRQGFSIPQIVKELNCNKSTVSLNCRSIKLTKEQRAKLDQNALRIQKMASSAQKQKWDDKIDKVKKEAIEEWKSVRKDPHIMGILGLYWGEGCKSHGNQRTADIGITNIDPDLVNICLQFFRKYSNKANNIYCTIRCYPEYEDEAKKYWESLLGLKIRKIDVVNRSKKKPKSNMGICYIKFRDWKLWHRIITWIECWKNEIRGS